MLRTIELPRILEENLGNEHRDFAVMAKRAQPLAKSMTRMLFSVVWLGFTSIFVAVFLGPIFQGKEVTFSSNDVPVTAGPGNLGPIVVPSLVIGLFVLIGLAMLIYSMYSLTRKGGYFVGTPLRLVSLQNGSIRSIDWELFSGDIVVKGDEKKGDISLGMRTGKMVSQKNGPDRYVPDVIYLSGIPDVFEVERLCRERIKENDPTPPAVSPTQI